MSDLTPDDLRRLREITEKAVNHRSAAEWASASELADDGWLSESAGYIAAFSPDTALLLLDMAERTVRAEAEVERLRAVLRWVAPVGFDSWLDSVMLDAANGRWDDVPAEAKGE